MRYIGHLPTRAEIFIGVELDGTGTLLKECRGFSSLFVGFSRLKVNQLGLSGPLAPVWLQVAMCFISLRYVGVCLVLIN